ncbi:MAG TPA: ATP-binding protein, partial [Ardenticatenaceae bacterium]|nr:ATP-binding protein [Ardenticatenaceae bacterium]
QNTSLRRGDRLIQVGETRWETFRSDRRRTVFDRLLPGQQMRLHIDRAGQRLVLDWVYPGRTRTEILARLNSQWFLPYFFWLAGTAALLGLRPRDTRRQLLVAFNFLTAIWLVTGSGVARWHIWEAAIVQRSAIWLSMPVFLHFHWLFPAPLRPLPAPIRWFTYLVGAAGAALEWFELLPHNAYILPFLVAVAGSLALLIAHFLFQPPVRRDITLLVVIVGSVLVPPIGAAVASAFTVLPQRAQGASLLALPLLPFAYLYAAHRRQIAGFELRANPLLALYLFVILLGSIAVVLLALVGAWLGLSREAIVIGAAMVVLGATVAVGTFGRFRRLVEQHLLGIPLPPTQLVAVYASRIPTSLERPVLVRLLTDEVLPSLLIRQSAILDVDGSGGASPLFAVGIEADQLPLSHDIPLLLAQAGKYRPPHPTGAGPYPCPWARLVLALTLGQEPIGLWLLGSRAPDDLYGHTEIPFLQTLADQTAVALSNIVQTERLRALYEANIERQEHERAELAWELHDDVLNQMARLSEHANGLASSGPFNETYEGLKARIRQMITGLRPAMLTYGLQGALDELAENLAGRGENRPAVELDLTGQNARYPRHVEQHLFRIVQQACENALRHARARTIQIRGHFEPAGTEIVVEDDGVGFEARPMDTDELLARKQFGLLGMLERAALIGADVNIDSVRGGGTRVRVQWPSGDRISTES